MKKFVYLCGMMLLSLNVMAQIDLNDGNWIKTPHFQDDFTETGRSWVNWLSYPDKKWMGYPGPNVISGMGWHHIYQYSNCLFSPIDGKMKLVGKYDSDEIIQNNQYELPAWMGNALLPIDSLFYLSGAITALKDSVTCQDLRFQYGYFEIRCKMPKHKGSHPAFWLHHDSKDTLDPYYEEIDIIECSWAFSDPNAYWLHHVNPDATQLGDPKYYSTAMIHNLHGHGFDSHTDVYGMEYIRIPNGQEDISGWHIYSCEWMPDHVYWYLDGNLVNSYCDQMHIPRHSLTLRTNYGIDSYAVKKKYNANHVFIGYEPDWQDSDTLAIDYIKVYQLDWDCDTDETITCQADLTNFVYKVKKSVAITSSVEEIEIGYTDKVTFRVANSFEITGAFQADNGCEFTVIRQDCPE